MLQPRTVKEEASADYWRLITEKMAEGIIKVLSGGKFSDRETIDGAIKLFRSALKGYPDISASRSRVYLLVKDVFLIALEQDLMKK